MYKLVYKVDDDKKIFLNDLNLLEETETHYKFLGVKSNRVFIISKDVIKTLIEY